MIKYLTLLIALCLCLAHLHAAQSAADDYALGPDSKPQAGIPAGKTFSFDITHSRIFPETHRTVTVYVPAEYRGDKPACLYVGLDGLGFNVPLVFDNLIAQKAMPVTIAIGLSSGTVDSAQPPENPRFDRSFEFDTVNDRLARFLLEEVLPEVEQHRTPDGKPILLSTDPNDRAIGGGSTGGIGAFNVAWQRPDQWRRVFTAIGTFVGMRGGEQFYVLVRKTEPKPLRVFMQDGANDEWGGGPEVGDWWMSNQTMERALSFAGYDVAHVWGTGTHSDRHASAIFPDAMRWLWRDYPKPIESRPPGNPVLQSVLAEGSAWQPASSGCSANIAVSTADGRVITAAQQEKILGPNLRITGLTIRESDEIYATAEAPDGSGQIWRIGKGGEKTALDSGLEKLSGLAFSPDKLWLVVARSASRIAYSYRVKEDGSLDAREPFFTIATEPAETGRSSAGPIWMDTDGRPYIATDLGVQIFDRNGRTTAILPVPNHEPVTGLAFGGTDSKTLYVLAGKTIYKRQMKVGGVPPSAPRLKLPKWGAG